MTCIWQAFGLVSVDHAPAVLRVTYGYDLISQARYSGYAALFTLSIVLIVILFCLQVWVVSLPLTILNSPAVSARSDPSFGTARDIVGIVLWGLGWLIESVADIQKVRVAPIGIHFTYSDPSPVL